MWIRSQDKKHLINSSFINVSPLYKDGTYKIIIDNQYKVGDYQSEKRCIEILDDITLKMFDCSKNYVYEMPNE
ncbi:hypothetical protein FDF26_14685 [Clostridium botulinum]|nr:hypothetical protein [Clostridium botulinum]